MHFTSYTEDVKLFKIGWKLLVLLSTVIYLDSWYGSASFVDEARECQFVCVIFSSLLYLSWKWNFNQNLTLHNQQKPLWVFNAICKVYPIDYSIHIKQGIFTCICVFMANARYKMCFSSLVISVTRSGLRSKTKWEDSGYVHGFLLDRIFCCSSFIIEGITGH